MQDTSDSLSHCVSTAHSVLLARYLCRNLPLFVSLDFSPASLTEVLKDSHSLNKSIDRSCKDVTIRAQSILALQEALCCFLSDKANTSDGHFESRLKFLRFRHKTLYTYLEQEVTFVSEPECFCCKPSKQNLILLLSDWSIYTFSINSHQCFRVLLLTRSSPILIARVPTISPSLTISCISLGSILSSINGLVLWQSLQ
ncbi:hypothetical protein Tco_0117284 [Tanacetum coccineum]